MKIFLDDEDYRKFTYVLSDVVDLFGVECWDFCLMPNHYHLCLCNRRPNLSDAIQHLNGVYGFWWNAKHGRVGHVFQGRFKDQIVQREGYFEALCRYIAQNPVRARLVDDPAAWVWSGFRALAGASPCPAFLDPQYVLSPFGGDDADSRQRYIRHVRMVSSETQLRDERLRSKERVLGDATFKRAIMDEWNQRILDTRSARATQMSSEPMIVLA